VPARRGDAPVVSSSLRQYIGDPALERGNRAPARHRSAPHRHQVKVSSATSSACPGSPPAGHPAVCTEEARCRAARDACLSVSSEPRRKLCTATYASCVDEHPCPPTLPRSRSALRTRNAPPRDMRRFGLPASGPKILPSCLNKAATGHVVNDPVEAGLVADLAQPGGNLTGISNLIGELNPKRLDRAAVRAGTLSKTLRF
jgi:hypothetical protein